jgi:hypothetical protein
MACGIYVVYPDALEASHTFLLEPWLNLFCLLAALAVFNGDKLTRSRRRLLLGGVAFGFAVAVKLWALVPLGIVALLLLAIPRCRSRVLPLVGGAVAGFGIPSLPFWIMAPAAFVGGVFSGQYTRSDPGGQSAGLYRVSDLFGRVAIPSLSAGPTVAVLAVLAVIVVAGCLVSRPWALDVFAVLGFAAVVAMMLLPRLYYSHYGSFAAPFLALTLALPLGRLLAAISARVGARGGAARALALALAVAASLPLIWLGVSAVAALTPTAGGPSAATVSRLIPAGACMVTDIPSYTIAADRFVTRPGCPEMVDPQGTLIAMTDGAELNGSPAVRAPVIAVWLAAFKQAEYVWLFPGNNTRIPWNHELHSYLTSNFHLIAFRDRSGSTRNIPPSGLYKRTA